MYKKRNTEIRETRGVLRGIRQPKWEWKINIIRKKDQSNKGQNTQHKKYTRKTKEVEEGK